MAIVYLGIGSNVGEKEKNCEKAIDLLNDVLGIEVVSRSALYITKPVGGPPQDDYFNGVLKIETSLSPEEIIGVVKGIEKKLGREVLPEKNQPRIIDIDMLFYDDIIRKEETLTIPHPRMHEREFVLRGFSEIAPEVIHPVLKKTVRELYDGIKVLNV